MRLGGELFVQMAATSTAMNNPRHLAVNMLRLLAVIEKTPAGYNCNSIQRLREQIDVLHRMRPTVALPDGLDMENVDRRIDAILELERIAKLAQHQCGEVEPSLSESKSRTDQVSSSHTQAAASAAPANEGSDEEDMRMALLTPKGAPSRKKIQDKSGKAPNGGSVSMQVLRIESISKMNKQLQSGMHDIRNSAIKVCSSACAIARRFQFRCCLFCRSSSGPARITISCPKPQKVSVNLTLPSYLPSPVVCFGGPTEVQQRSSINLSKQKK